MKLQLLHKIIFACLFTLLLTPVVSYADDQVITLDISANRSQHSCALFPVFPLEQSYVLTEVPDPANAKGVIVLFVGGSGKLGAADGQTSINALNFLYRSRHLFASQNYNVAVMDAASDFLVCSDGLRNRRTSGKFTKDIQAVVNDLRLRYPGQPVWLVGTSRGSIAAAQGAATVYPAVDGLVLTTPMTNPITSTVFDVALDTITMPTMITTNENDGCFVTPPSGVYQVEQALTAAKKVKIKVFDGGFPDVNTNPCRATTAHGYLGLEPKVVKKITNWITGIQMKDD